MRVRGVANVLDSTFGRTLVGFHHRSVHLGLFFLSQTAPHGAFCLFQLPKEKKHTQIQISSKNLQKGFPFVGTVKSLRGYIFQIYERLHFCRFVIQKISVAVHGVLQSTEVSEDWLAFRCVGYVLLKPAQYSRKAKQKQRIHQHTKTETNVSFVRFETYTFRIKQQQPNLKKKCPKH